MTLETLYLGPAPADEDCTQIKHPDYESRGRKEAQAYIAAIRKHCGPEPDGAGLRIKREHHEFGSYLEVVLNYDGDNQACAEYAPKLDGMAPRTWAEAGMESPHATPADGRRYVGRRTEQGVVVNVVAADGTETPLDPRFDLRKHSPDGFEMGYTGSGPAQLALAIVADALGDAGRTQRLYQDFKAKVIARIKDDSFDITQDSVRQAVAEIEAKSGRGA